MTTDDDGAAPRALNERVQRQREQPFKATSIVECCAQVSRAKSMQDERQNLVPALDAARDLLDAIAATLEDIGDECERSVPKRVRATGARAPPRRRSTSK